MSLKKHTNGPLVYVLAVVAFAALIAAAIHLFGSVPSNAAALVRTANPIVLSVTPPAAQPAPVAASPAAAEPAAARPAIPPVIEGDPQARQAKPGASAAVAAVRADVLPAPTTAKAAPAKATPSAPARPAAKSDGLVRVVEAALASDVVDREPVGAGTSFSLDEEKIWAWVKLENTGEPTSVTMVWRKGDEVAFRYELKVGQSKSWRTWSRKTVRKGDAGDWSVDVLDADGALLKTLDFTLGADGTTAG